MTDARGQTPLDADFFLLDPDTWVRVDEPTPDHTVKSKTGRFAYQKIADGNTLPLVITSDTDCGAPDWRTWRGRETGMRWEEIAAQYRGMVRAHGV